MTVDAQILSAMRRAGAGSVSGADLAQQLGMSRAAVWARIEELRKLGYEITANPHQGYRLLSTPDALHADDLLARLPDNQIVGRDIRVFEETNSTNDVAEKLARDGVREGVVVFAESQKKGRGRLGRQWHSPARKGLWFSVLLRPDLRPQAATQLTVVAATALARAIRKQTGLMPEIKWPNDILLRGKKVAGILTELSAELDHVKHLIIGIGVTRAIGVVVRRSFAGVTEWNVAAKLSQAIATKVMRQPAQWHGRQMTGDLVSRVGVDVDATVGVLAPLPFSTSVLVLVVTSGIWLMVVDLPLGLVALLLIPCLLLLNVGYQKRIDVFFDRAQHELGELSEAVHESFEGVLVVKVFGAEDRETTRLSTISGRLRDARIRAVYARSTFEALLDFVPASFNVLLILIGAHRVSAGAMTLGRPAMSSRCCSSGT